MATPSPTPSKNELGDELYFTHEPQSPNASTYDTSIDNTIPVHTDQVLSMSSSIDVDAPVSPSNETTFDLLHGFSAPTLPVYINMGLNERADDVQFAERTTTTTNQQLSHSLAAIDVDHTTVPTTVQRYSQHHHHHFPHHQQNRNRYPYLQRSLIAKAQQRADVSTSSPSILSYYEQRPAFRRSYFALRRQRIPKAPPMPKHLFPGYKQNRTSTSTTGRTGDDNENVEEEGKFMVF
ncbi:unnamed protein product [Rotaria magnacalcarata]|uniref:Uncharacterized protein n=1 Tax=Rotaria magnacalcarata TaxID=392030 RepID=A0A819MMU4_9BILA|nr:unnamed protein product [Rotaria magnacalcarata]CAF2159484.1 unnamed protein product [Rotaria magnacalcarata]CAF3870735.1 unnamed protein product [Rotaria magnacalcarata]CAF3981366.1 unnamed protein product [Rotaria magnacalcarata]